MKTPHKHAELIKAWADGAKIQVRSEPDVWLDCIDPYWAPHVIYRIKPEPKPDVVRYATLHSMNGVDAVRVDSSGSAFMEDNLKLIFDGETGKLKSAEVL